MKKFYTVLLILVVSLILNFLLLKNLNNTTELEKIIGDPTQSWLLLKQNNTSCFGRTVENSCIFNKGSPKKIVLIGDSHMGSLSSAFRPIINEGIELTVITGCEFYYGLQKTWHDGRKDCTDLILNNIFEFIKNKKNTLFIFHTRLTVHINNTSVIPNLENKNFQEKYKLIKHDFYFKNNKSNSIDNPEIIAESYVQLLKMLSSDNKFLIIYPVPETIYGLRDKIKKEIRSSRNKVYLNTITDQLFYPRTFFDKRYYKTKNIFDSISEKRIVKFNPTNIFCDTIKCYMWREGKPLYFDHSHISYEGANVIFKLIHPLIKKNL